jgi:hypothetical protein
MPHEISEMTYDTNSNGLLIVHEGFKNGKKFVFYTLGAKYLRNLQQTKKYKRGPESLAIRPSLHERQAQLNAYLVQRVG